MSKTLQKYFYIGTYRLEIIVCPYLVKLKLHTLCDPTILLLGVYILKKHVHIYTKIHNQEPSWHHC